LKIDHNQKGKPVKNSEVFLGEFRTKSKIEFIKKIESLMIES